MEAIPQVQAQTKFQSVSFGNRNLEMNIPPEELGLPLALEVYKSFSKIDARIADSD